MQDLIEARHVFRLAARLFSAEIDVPVLRALLRAEAEVALVDDRIRALDEQRAVEELSVEFCRLFVGPRPECPPYESVQRGEATLGGRAEQRIREFMHREGLDAILPPGLAVLTHDHLAVELAFFSRLCDIAAESPPASQAVQRFHEHHLLPWAPLYLHQVHSAARLEPYRTIALSTALLLKPAAPER